MTIEIIELISEAEISAAADSWRAKSGDSLESLIVGRKIALGKAKFDSKIIPELLRIIQCGPKRLMEIASLIVKSLTERFDEASPLISQLARSKRVQGRLGAIYSLSPALKEEFLRSVLTELLGDPSKKVREMAIDWITRNGKREFLPLLETTLENESDSVLRAFLARELALLARGYFIERDGGAIYITVMTPSARIGGFVNINGIDDLGDDQLVKVFLKNRTA